MTALAPLPDTLRQKARVGEVSKDAAYLRHEFLTYLGYSWSNGWTPPEAREAVNNHLRGVFWQSAMLSRDVVRYPPIMGALKQRLAPALRTNWKVKILDGFTLRAPTRLACEDLQAVWERFRAAGYRDALRDYALPGVGWSHLHWEVDARGIEIPIIKRWPLEAVQYRQVNPAMVGGYYASAVDAGLVRMVHGDGHWMQFGAGERPHEFGSIIALALSYTAGELARRDRAGLSEAAGRAAPVAMLPKGVRTDDERGQAALDVVAGLGRARKGAVLPYETKLEKFEITSDTSFFTDSLKDELALVAFALLGQSGTLAQGTGGVYTAPVFEGVAEALIDEQHEATERAFNEGVVRPFIAINYPDVDPDSIALVGERPDRDRDARLEAEGKRATSFATIVKAQRDGGLEPEQKHVDALAARLEVDTVPVGEKKEPTGPAGALVTVGTDPAAAPAAPAPSSAPPADEPKPTKARAPFAERNAAFYADLKDAKTLDIEIDQELVNALALEHEVTAPTLKTREG